MLTKKKIKKQLDKAGIEYESKATKDELLALLPEEEELDTEIATETPVEEESEEEVDIPLEEDIEVIDPSDIPEPPKPKKSKLGKPGWVDSRLWGNLDDKRKKLLISGVSIANLYK